MLEGMNGEIVLHAVVRPGRSIEGDSRRIRSNIQEVGRDMALPAICFRLRVRSSGRLGP